MISSAKGSAREAFPAFLEQDLNTELLRFTTAGSVDDGKSTLIGRKEEPHQPLDGPDRFFAAHRWPAGRT